MAPPLPAREKDLRRGASYFATKHGLTPGTLTSTPPDSHRVLAEPAMTANPILNEQLRSSHRSRCLQCSDLARGSHAIIKGHHASPDVVKWEERERPAVRETASSASSSSSIMDDQASSDPARSEYVNHREAVRVFRAHSELLGENGVRVPQVYTFTDPLSLAHLPGQDLAAAVAEAGAGATTATTQREAGVKPDDKRWILMERIHPLPEIVRDRMAEALRPPLDQPPLPRHMIHKPTNWDNNFLLVRPSFTWPPITHKDLATGTSSTPEDLRVPVWRLARLGMDVASLACKLGRALAVLHWAAGLDGLGVKFVIGTMPVNELGGLPRDSSPYGRKLERNKGPLMPPPNYSSPQEKLTGKKEPPPPPPHKPRNEKRDDDNNKKNLPLPSNTNTEEGNLWRTTLCMIHLRECQEVALPDWDNDDADSRKEQDEAAVDAFQDTLWRLAEAGTIPPLKGNLGRVFLDRYRFVRDKIKGAAQEAAEAQRQRRRLQMRMFGR